MGLFFSPTYKPITVDLHAEWVNALPLSMHWIYCAITGYGKSEFFFHRIVQAALAGPKKFAIVAIVPFGKLPKKVGLSLIKHGQTSRLLYDQYAVTGPKTLGFQNLERSNHPDPVQCEALDKKNVNRWIAWLVQHRDAMNALLTPLIRIGLKRSGRFLQQQPNPIPEWWLLDVLEDPESLAFEQLMRTCLHRPTRRAWARYAHLSRRERDQELQPIVRIAEEVLDAASIKARDGGIITPEYWREFLNKGGIYIGDGNAVGDEEISPDERRHQEARIVLWTLDACRRGVGPDVLLCLDEPFVEGLIDKRLSDSFASARNDRCFMHLAIQDIEAIDPAIRTNIDTNSYKVFGRQGPTGAALVEKGIGTCLLDDEVIWYHDEDIRQVHGGYQLIDVPRGETSTAQLVQKYDQQTRTIARRKTYDMQKDNFRSKLLQLKPGWFYVHADTISQTPRYCPMLEVPWASSPSEQERRWNEAMTLIQSRPEYRTVKLREPQAPPPQSTSRKPKGKAPKGME